MTFSGRVTHCQSQDTFRICNTGSPQPLDERKIFEPFFKGSKQEGSTGLGLSLVDGICKLSGLAVSYAFQDDMHCFCIRVKQSPN